MRLRELKQNLNFKFGIYYFAKLEGDKDTFKVLRRIIPIVQCFPFVVLLNLTLRGAGLPDAINVKH